MKSLGTTSPATHDGYVNSGITQHDMVPRAAMTCQYRRVATAAIGEASRRHRARGAASADGRVLEIGARDIGDLLRYRRVSFLALVQPCPNVRSRHTTLRVPAVQLSEARLEGLPFPTGAFDVVICSFSLCSADQPHRALAEISRVLRPTGHLTFLEHTRGPGAVGRMQDRVEAMLRGSGRCRPNLDVPEEFRKAGFVLRESDLFWPNESLNTPLVEGIAAHPDVQRQQGLGWLYGSLPTPSSPVSVHTESTPREVDLSGDLRQGFRDHE
jgi:SAM-dependent methyltransferase